MKILITFISLTLLFLQPEKDRCIKGDISYSIAKYSDELFLKDVHRKLLDSLLHESVTEYFCKGRIKNLPTKTKDKSKGASPSESHIIEPLFLDLSTFNGIYGQRIFPLNSKVRRPTRFRCGFYHHLFIISDNTYIELERGDTLKNEKLIVCHLSKSFTEKEISKMVDIFNYGLLGEQYTLLPTFYIKRSDSVIFSSLKESSTIEDNER